MWNFVKVIQNTFEHISHTSGGSIINFEKKLMPAVFGTFVEIEIYS